MKKKSGIVTDSGILWEIPVVWLTDEACEARELVSDGACVIFVLTEKNRGISIPDIRYCVELGEDWDSCFTEEISEVYLKRVWQRHVGQPWHILDTARLRVREMTAADLDTLYELHSDPEMERFVDRLLPKREAERARIEEYVRHMYGFYEFGIWLVTLLPETAESLRIGGSADAATRKVRAEQPEIVIGRAGLQMREGFESPELGFAIAAPYRQRGYAKEVCRAVLHYGFEELELPEIRVVVRRDNEKSLRLCEKLGFVVDNSAELPEDMWTGLCCRPN